MKPTAVRTIARADRQTIEGLAREGVSTVHEAQERSGLMQPYMRPIYAGAQIAGSAVTVLANPGDNLMIHVACELVEPGDIMVVACSSENTDGMFGELLGTSLQAKGVKGLIIDAGCRDVRLLSEMKFPVWSRAISSKGTVKASLGSVNIPVVCGGALVNPGDVVVADDDGIVIVPRLTAAAVLKAAQDRSAKEEKVRERLAKGELGLDIYNMRVKLTELGLRYVDKASDV
jgi:4-hydroxy-4-methyl-2-oxoglutarate aldolase